MGESAAAFKEFLAPDVVLEEFPNVLAPLGKKRDLAAALEGTERGKKVMSRQMYKIKQEIADHDRVALEVEWVETLAVPFGSIPAGGQMKAFFAVFLEFREGKIHQLAELRLFRGLVANETEKGGSSSRVLLPNSLLWYRSAIVLEEASSQYLGVWARFVLFTSSLLFCRFSTLLTRYVRGMPVD